MTDKGNLRGTTDHRLLPSFMCACCLLMTGAAHALDISGATTVQPIVEKLIPLYTAQGGELTRVTGGGSAVGAKDALSGKSQIGMVSRALHEDEKLTLKNTVVALDALAFIVNKSNPVNGLTKAQIVAIYTGKIDNWKDVGGPDRKIVRVAKEVGRSTLELMEHYTGLLSPDRKDTGGKPLVTKQVHTIGSNMESITLVGGMPAAIGYVSVGTALAQARTGMPVKLLILDGIPPTKETIKAKSYPVLRPLNLVYLKTTPAITSFLNLALSPKGQAAVASLGYLPVDN